MEGVQEGEDSVQEGGVEDSVQAGVAEEVDGALEVGAGEDVGGGEKVECAAIMYMNCIRCMN